MSRFRILPIALSLGSACLIASVAGAQRAPLEFEEVAEAVGIDVVHQHSEVTFESEVLNAGGAAGGDFNGDGWPDLFVIGGDGDRQYLFRNLGDGRFREEAIGAGVALAGEVMSGPAFADIDGDGDLDLFVGVVPRRRWFPPVLLRNDGDAGFVEVGRANEMFPPGLYASATFGDYNGDGWLDLFTTHWGVPVAFAELEHLWRNTGNGMYVGATEEAQLTIAMEDHPQVGLVPWTFVANFADIDDDGYSDLLVTSDFSHSQAFRNRADGTFEELDRSVFTDEAGMGAAVGDFNNDGNLDWFVTSIYLPGSLDVLGSDNSSGGATGNRLYENLGDGGFVDRTTEAGVRDGAWGWAACAADFDNDGWLDLFHVNGWQFRTSDLWFGRPARLFRNLGEGVFDEVAEESGIADRGEGRGVVCFDYDRDGDIDVLVANISGRVRLYRNRLDGSRNYLHVKLVGKPPNTEAIGARLWVEAGGRRQVREIRSGSNYVSQDPAVAHFGLGDETRISELRIRWPNREESFLRDLEVNQHLVVLQVPGDVNCDGAASAADLSASLMARAQESTLPPCPRGDLDGNQIVDARDLRQALASVFR